MKKIYRVLVVFLALFLIEGCSPEEEIIKKYVTQDYNVEYTNEEAGWRALVYLSSECFNWAEHWDFYGETFEESKLMEEAYFNYVELLLDNFQFEVEISKNEIVKKLKDDTYYVGTMSAIKTFMEDEAGGPDYYEAIYYLWQYQGEREYETSGKISEFDYFFIKMIEKVYPDILKKGVPYIIENEIGFNTSAVERLTQMLKDIGEIEEYQDFFSEIDNNDSEIEQKSEPSIGMTASEVRSSSWGSPNDINKTTTAYGVNEQWVYGGGRYIYFEDGIVSAIQE